MGNSASDRGQVKTPPAFQIKVTNNITNSSVIFHNAKSWAMLGYNVASIEPNGINFLLSGVPEGFDDLPQPVITNQSGAISNRSTNTFVTYQPREMGIPYHLYSMDGAVSERAMENLSDVLTTHQGQVLSVECYFPEANEGYLTYALVAEGQSLSKGKLILNDQNENLFMKYTINSSNKVVFDYALIKERDITENGNSLYFNDIGSPRPLRILVGTTTQQVVIQNMNNGNYCHRNRNDESNFLVDSFLNWAGSTNVNWVTEFTTLVNGQPIWLSPGDNRIRFSRYNNEIPNYSVTAYQYDVAYTVPMFRILGQESW